MNYALPKTAEVNGVEYGIRSDYRPILDILTALNDPDLTNEEKVVVILTIFYEDIPPKEDWEEAVKQLFLFIQCGEEEDKNKPRTKLVDWEQDFHFMIGPINKAAGTEIRAVSYLHWWTFISYYNEMDGESVFAQIVRIRDKKKRGKKLTEDERRFYRNNTSDVEFRKRYTEDEQEMLKDWVYGRRSTGQHED